MFLDAGGAGEELTYVDYEKDTPSSLITGDNW